MRKDASTVAIKGPATTMKPKTKAPAKKKKAPPKKKKPPASKSNTTTSKEAPKDSQTDAQESNAATKETPKPADTILKEIPKPEGQVQGSDDTENLDKKPAATTEKRKLSNRKGDPINVDNIPKKNSTSGSKGAANKEKTDCINP